VVLAVAIRLLFDHMRSRKQISSLRRGGETVSFKNTEEKTEGKSRRGLYLKRAGRKRWGVLDRPANLIGLGTEEKEQRPPESRGERSRTGR